MSDFPPVVFVTGTDTDVGKTVTSAALAVALGQLGSVAVYKPVQSGVASPAHTGDGSDVDEVRRLVGSEQPAGWAPPTLVEGIRLTDALAPVTAAARQGVRLPSVADHAARVAELAARHGHVLVEGSGGLLVGLDADGAGLADIARRVGRPVGFVVVVRAALGTLNHSALTVEALRSRGCAVLGLVVGAWPETPDLAQRCNLVDLPAVIGIELLGKVPDGAGGLSAAEFRAQVPAWLAPPLGEWRP